MINIDSNEIYPIVKRFIDKGDLEGLLKLAAPPEEYDHESAEIAEAIKREGPISWLGMAKIVRMVFFHKFHSWTREDMPNLRAYIPTAYELWKELPKPCVKGDRL